MTTLKSNMLKKGKKGFTLTELAIVIAVIAILIAVLVPTFTSVITNAKKTAAAEDATHAITAYTLETYDSLPDDAIIKSGDYYLTIEGGTVSTDDSVCTTTEPTDLDSMVAYVWGADTDSSLTSLTIYLPTSGVTQNVAEAIAQNYVDSLDSTALASVAYVGVEYKEATKTGAKIKLTDGETDGETEGETEEGTEEETTTATYYYFSVTSGVVKYTSTAPDSSKYTLNNTTYTGVVYYTATQTANAG